MIKLDYLSKEITYQNKKVVLYLDQFNKFCGANYFRNSICNYLDVKQQHYRGINRNQVVLIMNKFHLYLGNPNPNLLVEYFDKFSDIIEKCGNYLDPSIKVPNEFNILVDETTLKLIDSEYIKDEKIKNYDHIKEKIDIIDGKLKYIFNYDNANSITKTKIDVINSELVNIYKYGNTKSIIKGKVDICECVIGDTLYTLYTNYPPTLSIALELMDRFYSIINKNMYNIHPDIRNNLLIKFS